MRVRVKTLRSILCLLLIVLMLSQSYFAAAQGILNSADSYGGSDDITDIAEVSLSSEGGAINTDSFLSLFGSDSEQLVQLLEQNGISVVDNTDDLDPNALLSIQNTIDNALGRSPESSEVEAEAEGNAYTLEEDTDIIDVYKTEEDTASIEPEEEAQEISLLGGSETQYYTPIAINPTAFTADVIAESAAPSNWPTNQSWAANQTNANLAPAQTGDNTNNKKVLVSRDFRGTQNTTEIPGALPNDGIISFTPNINTWWTSKNSGANTNYFNNLTNGYTGWNPNIITKNGFYADDPLSDVTLENPTFNFELRPYNGNNSIHCTSSSINGYQSFTADFQNQTNRYSSIAFLFGDPLQYWSQYTFTMHFDDGSTYTKNVSSALSTSASNYANVGTLSIYNYSSAWTSVANAMVRRESLDSANLYDSIYRTNGGLGMIVIHLPGEYRYKRMTYISGYNSGDILAISGVLIPENPVFNTPPQELNTFEFSTVGQTTATLQWTDLLQGASTIDGTSFEKYELEISQDPDFTALLPGYPKLLRAYGDEANGGTRNKSAQTYSYNVTGLIPSTTYYARIRLTNGSSNEFKTDYYQTKASVKTLEPKLVEFQIGSDGGLFTFDENAASTQLIDDKKYADSDTIILPEAPAWFGYDKNKCRYVLDYWSIGNGTAKKTYHAGDSVAVSVLAAYASDNILTFTANYKRDYEEYGTFASRSISGTGASYSPYIIDTAEKLLYVMNRSRGDSFEGVYFRQDADIDLSDISGIDFNNDGRPDGVYPIGGITNENAFKGYYNGNGKSISGYSFTYDGAAEGNVESPYIGLFGHIVTAKYAYPYYNSRPSVINELVLKSAVFNITNCTSLYFGGFAGYIEGEYNCSSFALNACMLDKNSSINVSDSTGYVGGIIGCNKIYTEYGDGYIRPKITRAAINKASIYVKSIDAANAVLFAGGIYGYTNAANVSFCYNQGQLISENNARLGGIAGQHWLDYIYLTAVYNSGSMFFIDFDTSRNIDEYSHWSLNGFDNLDLNTNAYRFVTDGRTVNGVKIDIIPAWQGGKKFTDLLKTSSYPSDVWPSEMTIENGSLPRIAPDYEVVSTQLGMLPDGAAIHVRNAGQFSHMQSGSQMTVELYGLKDTVEAPLFNQNFLWESSNTKVCTVTSGTIKALIPGSAVVTAVYVADPAKTVTINVTVEGTNVTGLTLKKDGYSINGIINVQPGNPQTVTAEISPPDASVKTLICTTSNPKVAAIELDNEKGEIHITGVGPGLALITVRTVDGDFTESFYVKSSGVVTQSLEIIQKTLDFSLGSGGGVPASEQLSVTATMTDSSIQSSPKVNYISTNQNVAVVDYNGKVYPTGHGTADIYAVSADSTNVRSNACTVTVSAARVTAVEPANSAMNLQKNNVAIIKMNVLQSNAANKRLSWTSSDPSVAYVDQNGFVTTLKKGYVVITAVSEDKPEISGQTVINVISPVVGVDISNKYKFRKLAVDKVVELGTVYVYPSDADDPTYTIESTDPSVASIEYENGSYYVHTHAAGNAYIKVIPKGDPSRTLVLPISVFDVFRPKVTVLDENTNQPISGAVIDIFGETYTTDTNGEATLVIPPDEPISMVKANAEGYREVRMMEGYLFNNSFTLYMQPENGEPYFMILAQTDDFETISPLDRETKATDKGKSVKLWTAIEWKNLTPGDVFLERGASKVRMTPMSDSRYQTAYQDYYNVFTGTDGDMTIRAISAEGTELLFPVKWGYLDYDEQIADIKLDQQDSDFTKDKNGKDTATYSTGFDMELPDGLPITLTIKGSKLYLSVQWTFSYTKGPGDDKFQKDPGALDYCKAIKESISTGKMSDKLKDLTKAPPTNKVEKRIQTQITIMGYMEGEFAKTTTMVDLQALHESGALEFLNVNEEDYAQLMAIYQNGFMPVTDVSLEVMSAGIKVTVDGKIIWSNQFQCGPVPVYVETGIGVTIDQLLAFSFKNNETQFRGATSVTPYFYVYGAVGIGGVCTIGPNMDGSLPIKVTYPKPRHFTIDLKLDFGIKLVFLFYDKTYHIWGHTWNLVDVKDEGGEDYDDLGEAEESNSLSPLSQSKGLKTLGGSSVIPDFEPMSRDYLENADNTGLAETSSDAGVNSYYNYDLHMTNGYPYLSQRLVQYYVNGSPHELLIWEDDKQDRTSFNRTALYFSSRQNTTFDSSNNQNSFSSRKLVEDDGTADGKFDVVSTGTDVYVAYEDLSKTLSNGEGFADFVNSSRVSLVKYKGETGAFETPIDLSRLATEQELYEAGDNLTAAEIEKINNSIDTMPKIATNGSDIVVTWVRNDNSDIFGFTGRSSVKQAIINAEGEVSVKELFSADNTPILYHSVGCTPHSSQPAAVYMTDEDGDFNTMNDRSLYVTDGSSAPVRVNTGSTDTIIDNPQLAVVGGSLSLFWYNSDGNINFIQNVGDLSGCADVNNVKAVFPTNPETQYDDGGTKPFPGTSSFKIINEMDENGNIINSALIYEAGEAYIDHYDSEGYPVIVQTQRLYYTPYDSKTKSFSGKAYALLYEDVSFDSVDGYLGGNGTNGNNWVNVAYSKLTDMDQGKDDIIAYEHRYSASLSLTRINLKPDLAVTIDGLLYNTDSVNSAGTSVYTYVYGKNVGRSPINGVKLELRDNSTGNLIKTEYFPDITLLPDCEPVEFGTIYEWPQPLTEHRIKAILLPLDGAEELRSNNNYAVTAFGGADLSLEGVIKSTAGKYVSVSGTIRNNSENTAEGLIVKLYKQDSKGLKTGDVLETVTLTGDLAGYGETGFKLDFDTTKINFEDDAEDAEDIKRNKYVLEVSSDVSDVVDYNNTETFIISNPYAQTLPFTISLNDLLLRENGSAALKIAVQNNIPEDNNGSIEVKVADLDGNILKVLSHPVSLLANEAKVITIDIEAFDAIESPDMIVASFINAEHGIKMTAGSGKEAVDYYSNSVNAKVAKLIPSSNTAIKSLSFTAGELLEQTDKQGYDYLLDIGKERAVNASMTVVPEDLGTLVSYKINNGKTAYVAAPEASEILHLNSNDIVSITTRAVSGAEEVCTVKVADTVPPEVLTVSPSGINVGISGYVSLAFNEAMDTSAGQIVINDQTLPNGVWSNGGTVYTAAYSGLSNSTGYLVNISGFKDTTGNIMTDDSSHGFTTIAALGGTLGITIDKNTGTLTADTTGVTGGIEAYSYEWTGASVTDSGKEALAITEYSLGETVTLKLTQADATGSLACSIVPYMVTIKPTGNNDKDAISIADPYGFSGDSIVIDYDLNNSGATYNTIIYSGGKAAPVDKVGIGSSVYKIDAGDAENGLIKLTAIFAHITLIEEKKTQPIAEVNGHKSVSGTIETETDKETGKTTTKITVDQKSLNDQLEKAGSGAVITIPFTQDADKAVSEINGQMVKDMEKQAAVLLVQTETESYKLPADQLSISDISKLLGENVTLSDIKVTVEIAKSSEKTVEIVKQAAEAGNLTLIVPAVDFNVSCTYEGKTVNVEKFNAYVERRLAIPEGVDPNQITTSIVVEPDGTTRHVPTKIILENGRYYAVVSSLTNSTYSVVYNPVEMSDVEHHWAKDSVNNMASRMIIAGVPGGGCEPDRDITRAEAAAILVRALGLKTGSGENTFNDISESDWYTPYIITAASYGLINGYGDGSFKPNGKITREQTMTMIARAMSITKLEIGPGNADSLLFDYADNERVALWSRNYVAACISAGLVSGRPGKLIAPQDNITRAEVAKIVESLLKKSGLID